MGADAVLYGANPLQRPAFSLQDLFSKAGGGFVVAEAFPAIGITAT